MIPKECKRLAEVDFPIAVVSRHAAREKSIRHGHPSTLHLWWARRPLASSRAVLMALLLPDPCDPFCPDDFKKRARVLLPQTSGPVDKGNPALRKKLLQFIGDFSNWDNAANPVFLEVGRGLVRAAHPDETPMVVDPFAGGGSIPLEALRLGCETFASDLNPVACLILKVMLEDIPRHGLGLADALRKVGGEIKAAAKKNLADLYPTDPDGATPIAYLWARTVRCESPNCGAEIPLMRSRWLCKKAKRKRALRTNVVRPRGKPPRAEFEIFEPKHERDVHPGTVTRARATCLCCGAVLPPERVRSQLAAEKGGADVIFNDKSKRIGGARLLAVVTLRSGEKGRHYRLPTKADYAAVQRARERLDAILAAWNRDGAGLCPVPDEPTPAGGGSGAGRAFSVQRYGMMEWGDLFTARQKVALVKLYLLIAGRDQKNERDLTTKALLGIAVNKTADLGNALTPWKPDAECPVHLFARQAIGMAWDFCESVPPCDSSGSFSSANKRSADALKSIGCINQEPAQVQSADVIDSPLPDEATSIWFTDPPYYDAIPYADLSDFFLVWLTRTLPNHPLLRDPFDPDNPLSHKTREAVQDETKLCDGRVKDRDFFEDAMGDAFTEGRRILRKDGIGSVVFAHKTTEGWEALLSGMISGGWTITGSWPIATEMKSRLRARDSAALATSVHLVCRPRPNDTQTGDWGEVLRELPNRVGDWMERLQDEGIRGADLIFACIGPALEIFSRYPRVETAEGREVDLAEYLKRVWEVVGRTALEQVLGTDAAKARNGAAGVIEEDARLTALFLWTLQDTSTAAASTESADEDISDNEDDDDEDSAPSRGKTTGFSLPYDVVRRFAQPMGINLDAWTDRIIKQEKGVVRLLPVADRAKALFGEDGARAAADWIERDPGGTIQQLLFPDTEAKPKEKLRRRGRKTIIGDEAEIQSPGATTLDRVHAAMLLQASGQANALRKLIEAEQGRGSDFLRLANALSALYPRDSEEKRLLDAMLLAGPR